MPLPVGAKLGPYEILALIGAGGMGEVYKAKDTRLGRTVAIKFLKSAHSERFEREARAIAALNHPYICALYDVGPDYLVMEYVEGKPLKGPVPPLQAVRLASQIAEALEAAHAKNIVHRDLKPGNILVTATGVKLLDFGLAKLTGFANSADATQTIEGTVLGTAAYMSPEQAQGKPLDARSDIFSYGLVLYEMISGQRAFEADTGLATMAAIVRDAPATLSTAPELQRIVERCLRKSPAERFQSAAEIRAALVLDLTDGASAREQPSIAVLPFANMSGEKENEYFSDGLAEEVINLLAQIPGLKVTARTSAFAFRGKEQDITGIAEALRVRTILEGSVRRARNRIRVTAQLINAADGYHVWSERFDRELNDVFAVQDEIAAAIASALKLKLGRASGAARRHAPTLAAYEACLKGRHFMLRRVSPGDLTRAKEYFEQAIALDPEYPDPLLDLAMAGFFSIIMFDSPARQIAERMRALAQRALALDPELPAGHGVIALVEGLVDYDWAAAGHHWDLAMRTSGMPGEAYTAYATFYLAPFGRFKEAADWLRKAVDRDPLNLFVRSNLAFHLIALEQYEAAAEEAHRGLEIDSDYWFGYGVLGIVALLTGRIEEARDRLERAYAIAPWNGPMEGMLAALLIKAGENARAETLIEQIPSKGAGAVGMVYYYSLIGNIDAAADWFEKGIQQRLPTIVQMSRHPLLKPLRQNSRWPALAKMMNLPETA